jgi:hypothetical protein
VRLRGLRRLHHASASAKILRLHATTNSTRDHVRAGGGGGGVGAGAGTGAGVDDADSNICRAVAAARLSWWLLADCVHVPSQAELARAVEDVLLSPPSSSSSPPPPPWSSSEATPPSLDDLGRPVRSSVAGGAGVGGRGSGGGGDESVLRYEDLALAIKDTAVSSDYGDPNKTNTLIGSIAGGGGGSVRSYDNGYYYDSLLESARHGLEHALLGVIEAPVRSDLLRGAADVARRVAAAEADASSGAGGFSGGSRSGSGSGSDSERDGISKSTSRKGGGGRSTAVDEARSQHSSMHDRGTGALASSSSSVAAATTTGLDDFDEHMRRIVAAHFPGIEGL